MSAEEEGVTQEQEGPAGAPSTLCGLAAPRPLEWAGQLALARQFLFPRL